MPARSSAARRSPWTSSNGFYLIAFDDIALPRNLQIYATNNQCSQIGPSRAQKSSGNLPAGRLLNTWEDPPDLAPCKYPCFCSPFPTTFRLEIQSILSIARKRLFSINWKERKKNLISELPLCHVVVVWPIVFDEFVDLNSCYELRKLFASILHNIQCMLDEIIRAVSRA